MGEHNLHVLHSGQSVVIAGCRFVGATLWTDFEIAGDQLPAFSWFNVSMPDAANIESDFGLLYAHALLQEHKKHLAAIEGCLAAPFDGPSVVVTHHAPHPRSLAVSENIDSADASFASDLTARSSGIGRMRGCTGTFTTAVTISSRTRGSSAIRGGLILTTKGQHRENRAFNPSLVIHV